MIKLEKYTIPTNWADLTVKQAKEITAWSESESKSPIKLLAILLSISEIEAANLKAVTAESMLTAIIENLNQKPDLEGRNAPDKLLGRKVEFNPSKMTIAQAWHLDGLVKGLKEKGMLEMCSKICAVCLAPIPLTDESINEIERDLQDENLFEVWLAADFFLKNYRDGLALQTEQLIQKGTMKSRSKQGLNSFRNLAFLTRFGRSRKETSPSMKPL